MKCPHCNKEHSDDIRYCPNTGKKIELLACQNKKCPDFGKKIWPADSKYCPICGQPLESAGSYFCEDVNVFMSFHNITLGETGIYDIDADEYQKNNESFFGDVKIISIEDVEYEGNTITCTARQSNKKIFSYSFDSLSDVDIPESWANAGLDIDNVLLSMEKMLCKQDFQWNEFEDPYDGKKAFAYKKIESDLFLVFAISEDGLLISLLTEEMKDSLKNEFESYSEDEDEEDDFDDDDDDDDNDCYLNGHEFVDLGLPSGTLWATCNIGANSPYDAGDYYAWGETRTKSNYTDNNYTNPGYVSKLDLCHDTANIKWGSAWRMPDKEDIIELVDNCTSSRVRIGRTWCMKFVGPNGNSILFPCVGYYSGTELSYDTMFYYWTSYTKFNNSCDFAGCFSQIHDDFYDDYEDRSHGLPIRPVSD